jgi:hypothetical protein
MKNSKPEDAVFTFCASCTVLAAGAALAALLYEAITVVIPLAASMMFSAECALRGL